MKKIAATNPHPTTGGPRLWRSLAAAAEYVRTPLNFRLVIHRGCAAAGLRHSRGPKNLKPLLQFFAVFCDFLQHHPPRLSRFHSSPPQSEFQFALRYSFIINARNFIPDHSRPFGEGGHGKAEDRRGRGRGGGRGRIRERLSSGLSLGGRRGISPIGRTPHLQYRANYYDSSGQLLTHLSKVA